jgi:hypothetical protein
LVKVPPLEQILCRGRFHHPGRYGCAPVFSSLHQNLLRVINSFTTSGLWTSTPGNHTKTI